MPFKIGWLDEKLHIYDIVLSDPFTTADQDQFFVEFFKFMDVGPVPMYGIFDVSKWSQSGAAGLNDPRFRKMGDYRKKIVVIVMVTKSKVTAAMGRLGAAVVGYRDWMHFEESRETAIKYLKERAVTDLAKRGMLPQAAATQAPLSQGAKVEAPKVEASKVEAPKVVAPKVEAPKVEAPKVVAPKVEALKVEAPKVEALKVEAPKVEAPKVEAPQVETPAPAPKVEAPPVETPAPAPKDQPATAKAPDQASQEQISKEQAAKDPEQKQPVSK